VIDRLICEDVFRGAVAASTPGRFVRAWLGDDPVRSRYVFGLALGNAAISMLRGAGPVLHGIAISRDDDCTNLPKGWSTQPPDETASLAILDLVAAATAEDVILVMLSAGAEAMLTPALTYGGLARVALAPIRTVVASDLPGDDLAVLCGAPTIPKRPIDHASVIAVGVFGASIQSELIERHFEIHLTSQPRGSVGLVADMVVDEVLRRGHPIATFLGRDELDLPAGQRCRAQTLALELAREIAGQHLSAFVAASSGWDGPHVQGRPHPAGAFVDGTTWATVLATTADPFADVHDALDRVGALVFTQLTGLDYGGDIVIIG
jgi:glycerate-2-kinase